MGDQKPKNPQGEGAVEPTQIWEGGCVKCKMEAQEKANQIAERLEENGIQIRSLEWYYQLTIAKLEAGLEVTEVAFSEHAEKITKIYPQVEEIKIKRGKKWETFFRLPRNY